MQQKSGKKQKTKNETKTKNERDKKWHFGFLPLKNPLHPLALRALLLFESTRALYPPLDPDSNLRCPLQFAVQGPFSPLHSTPRCSAAVCGVLLAASRKIPKENKGPNPRNPLPDTDTGG